MSNILKILILILLTQTCYAQKFDSNLVSKKMQLNFFETNMRGIELNRIVYFVEKDLQSVAAYKSGKQIWRTNVISVCGKPSIGKPEIRHIKYSRSKLLVTFGKHNFAEVDIASGKAMFLGSD